MNAYDILAEIGVDSVQRDARRHVLGHESLAARHPTGKESRRDHTASAEGTSRPTRNGTKPRRLTSVMAATRVAIGITLALVGRRVRGATGGPDAAPGSPGPSGRFGTSGGDAPRGSPPQSTGPLVRPPR
jgi:hypothetical protein